MYKRQAAAVTPEAEADADSDAAFSAFGSDDDQDTEFPEQEPDLEGGEPLATPSRQPVKRKAVSPRATVTVNSKPKTKRKKIKRVRDPRDPTFFMIRYACLLFWKTFDKANWKPNLIGMRKHLRVIEKMFVCLLYTSPSPRD